jgi:hypothetical protein
MTTESHWLPLGRSAGIMQTKHTKDAIPLVFLLLPRPIPGAAFVIMTILRSVLRHYC